MSLKYMTSVKTNWVKAQNVQTACFVGKEALAIGMGCHILLMNVVSKKESYYRATDRASGEGVACLAGHKTFSVYAFAESCASPRIFIVTYPDNAVLFVLEGDGKTHSYISLCFSEGEYLLALSGIPEYSLEVYVWRNKELLMKRKTGINTDKQRILSSPASTITICQLAYNQALVTLWEIHGNVRICRLIEKSVKLPFGKEEAPLDCTFSIDGTLMVINKRGCVHSFSANSGQLNQIIPPSIEVGSFDPLVFYCKGGLFLGGPEGSVSFYKRQKGVWNQLWITTPPESYALLLLYSASDGLYGTTTTGNLVRTIVDNDLRNVEFVPVKEFDCQFKNFVALNPLGEVLIAVDSFNVMIAFDAKTGVKISHHQVDDLSCIKQNPLFPFVAVGMTNGIVALVSYYHPETPSELTTFHLSHAVITDVQFSDDGTYFAVYDENHNIFFIKGVPGTTMDVIHHLEAPQNLFQPSFQVHDNSLSIVSLILDDDLEHSSLLTNILISLENGTRKTKTGLLPKKYVQIKRKFESSSRFYAVSHLSNEIDILKVESDEELTVSIVSTFKVKHQIPYFHIYVDQFHLMTWSVDGLVTIYDAKTEKLLAFFIAHDRTRKGVQLVRCDPLHQYIFTLGHTGCLLCTKIHRSAASNQRYNDLKLGLETDDVMSMFKNPTTGFNPKGFTFTRWIDMEKISRLESEKLECKQQKAKLWRDFRTVRTKLKELLDRNEVTAEEERLPIQAFNLNARITEQLKQSAKWERAEEHRKLSSYITRQGKINERIIQNCWNIMERKPVKVRSIFTKLAVENYPSLPNERDENFLSKMAVYRETELMASHDALLPWKPTPTYQLESILNRDPDYGNVIDVLSRAAMKKYYTLTGTTTHLYVEPMTLRFEQLEVVTFEQLYFEKVYGSVQILQLRDIFNKKFDALKEMKDTEMDVVLKRNNRLRVIQQELSIITKLLEMPPFQPESIVDPRFQSDEIPHTIVKTENHEISVAPYLTPSMENLLAQEKAERERRQRELMADDFKDRALMMMMDGVLEHRWEDEIKKTPPVPHCLETGKDPQYYNETDIREVKEYEEQLEFLHKERTRYRKILEVEKAQIVENLEDQIKKFNTKVGECLLEKICIESAIREEEMRILRNALYNHQRLIYDRNVIVLREDINAVSKHIDALTETMQELQDKVNDYKNTYEALSTKDRMLDKQFKINFSDTAQSAIVDQAYKIFKKRPKSQLRAIVSVSIFQDLAKRIMAKKTVQQSNILLPQECTDYLSACDVLDQMSNCPAGMDSTMWQTLCKMRRIKLESEFKLKSCEIQLADSEAALNAFQKEITSKRNALSAVENKQRDLFNKKFENSTNRNVQIVMKRGLIEVPMSGKMTDFNKCILIHRTDVDDINVIIKRAGAKKLKAMVNAALFRRKIIAQEWDHKALRLKIRDLKDQVKMIEKCKITKEVQDWLKRKEKGMVEDLGQLALEKEIENTIYAQEKMLQEVKRSVEELEEKIIVKRKENKVLDKETQELNIDVTEQHLQKDSELEESERQASQARMTAIVERARLVRLVQSQHSQILELGTMLELQRLKTYPTLTASSALVDRHVK